ncbi:uncharacterized protein LOC126375944 [Pectinophora gossypiella]|uniref:uncharacterized protein LOC126375944 n=1 Tax=Pectinophora gossypiella TaxID=13191 RepID=UPI00214F0990|nr:uncharacterized protein LOC126375944 [Pectinophora gossypiella]
MSAIYVVDIVLLVILYLLIMFMCGYSVFCVYRLIRSMQMRILLRPTRVLFSHKKEGESTEELRTVVAYQNPFTGDYCVRKSRLGQQGYMNSLPGASPDSGLSDEYEPLHLEPAVPGPNAPGPYLPGPHSPGPLTPGPYLPPEPYATGPYPPPAGYERNMSQMETVKLHLKHKVVDNTLNKTWNWNYKEYQI